MLLFQLCELLAQKSREPHAGDRFSAIANAPLDLLQAPPSGRRFALSLAQSLDELLLEARERVRDNLGVHDPLLQPRKQLLLESVPRDEQIIFADVIAAEGVHRATVARLLAFLPSAGNDRDASVAKRTLEEAGEEIR